MNSNLLAVSGALIVDVVAVAFVLIFTVKGFKQGFAKTFFSMFGSLFSLVFAALLCSTVAQFLQDKFSLVDKVGEGVSGFLTKTFGDGLMNTTLGQASEDVLGGAGVGGWLVSLIMQFKADTSIPLDTTLNQLISPTFSYYIVLILALIGLYIVFRIIFWLIGSIVKSLHKVKLVATLDKTLGLVLGLISGIIYLELLIMVISILPLGFCQDLYVIIHQTSTFAKFIEGINLFNLIMGSVSFGDVMGYVKTLI